MLSTVEARVQIIMKYMKEFYKTRFEQVVRINPSLLTIQSDMEWRQEKQLELVLRSKKTIGVEKAVVSDILLGHDETMKRKLMAPSDQLSIFHQLIELEEEAGTQDVVSINNLKTLYKFIDNRFENMTLMTECWLIWDLMDAVEIARMNDDITDITYMLNEEKLSPEIEAGYRREKKIDNPSIPVSLEEVLIFRYHFLHHLVEKKEYELSIEPPYRMVIRRDPQKGLTFDNQVIKYYQSLAKIHNMKKTQSVNDTDKKGYCDALGMEADEFTLELALQYENMTLESAKEGLVQIAKGATVLGPPYNLKEAYLRKIAQAVDKLTKCPKMQSIIEQEKELEEEEA